MATRPLAEGFPRPWETIAAKAFLLRDTFPETDVETVVALPSDKKCFPIRGEIS